MRIAYCTNVRLPTERAHGHQVVQVCNALAELGHEVTIFAPFRKNVIKQTYHQYYGANPKVTITHLGSFDPIDHLLIPKILQLPILNFFFKKSLNTHLQSFDLLYTRTPALLDVLVATKKQVIAELHTVPRRIKRLLSLLNKCASVICLTDPMANEIQQHGVHEDRVFIAADAFDPLLFEEKVDKREVQKKYGLTSGAPIIGYTGQLATMGLSKGLPELMEAFNILHRSGVSFQALIAGGPYKEAEKLKKGLNTDVQPVIHFVGTVAHKDVPAVLGACDVLVYPAPKSSHPFYTRDTSPLKLFEYMASGIPIVCADLLPLRDIVDENCVVFFKPGDSAAMAKAIEDVLKHPTEATNRARKAKELVYNRHTWANRMAFIINTLS